MPRVSAIITTFNRKHLLERAIESVLRQTFRDFELLVLDNASTDGTDTAVSVFGDARVRYLAHPPMTIGAARNFGVQQAAGEYVAFLDDDDEWLPGKLGRQVAAFERSGPEVGLIYGGFIWIDAHGRESGMHRPALRGRVLTDLLLQRDAFTGSASNPMIPARVLRELGGYDATLKTSEDWELYLRLAERFTVDHIPEPVVRIRRHSTARLGDRIADAGHVEEQVLRRYGSIMDHRLRSYYLQKIGGKLCRTGDLSAGRLRLREAIRTNPRNALAAMQYLTSFLGPGVYRAAHRWYKRSTAR